MKFEDLEFKPHSGWSAEQAKVSFPNGYGASIVTGRATYSDKDKPYELAVLDLNGRIAYDTPITDDVLGYLTKEEVEEVLTKIEALPNAEFKA